MVAGLGSLAGCTVSEPIPFFPTPTPTPVPRWVTAVATSPIVADLVRSVGGGRVEVRTIMPQSADPHVFRATEGDGALFDEIDVVFHYGLGISPYLQPLMDEAAKRLPVVAVTRDIPPNLLRYADDAEREPDPHIWQDPALWARTAVTVSKTLQEFDSSSAHRRTYELHQRLFADQLDLLDRYQSAMVARIPPDRRVLVTPHDAFGYFAVRYGFETYSLQGVSTDATVTEDQVEAFADVIRRVAPAALFIEASAPTVAFLAARDLARSDSLPLPLAGPLFSDGFGDGPGPTARYLGVLRSNVNRLAQALGN
jgi:manganese/zinc/iron transport system substrate-binding protein